MQIPEGLAQYRQFILYTPDKQPVSPHSGYPCDLTDPSNWADGPSALAAAQRYGYGVGFVFTNQDPFFFFDLDKALVNGEWSDLAQQMCRTFAGCYLEVSQSGTGLHIIGTGAPAMPHGHKNAAYGLELYTAKRFCALTGTHANGSALQLAQPQIDWLASTYFPPSAATGATAAEWSAGPCAEWSGPAEDADLLARMLSARASAAAMFGSRATVQQLWEADPDTLAQYYPPQQDGQDFDHSSADLALCSHLAFWTGKDCERMDRLFRQSGLYREKWERDDYRVDRCILKANGLASSVLGDRRQPTADEVASVQGQPVMQIAPGGLRAGLQYMSVPQQVEHFAGCCYIRDIHRIFTPDGGILKAEQFNATYGGYIFALDMTNGKTSRNAWEVFTQSQGYIFPRAHTVSFRPELAPGELFQDEGWTLVNTYVPITTRRQPGDPWPFLNHLAKMIPDPRDRAILTAYMAAVVQRPGKKFMWAPLIQGTKGNGKSLLGKILTHAVGNRYTAIPDPDDISNKFNAWIAGKALVIIDEAYVADRRDMETALKRLIGSDRMALQGKGADQYTGDNRANFFLNSNYKTCVRMDDDERRYSVFFTAQQSRKDIERDGMGGDYFPQLVAWLEAEGYAIINDYLQNYPISDEFNPALLARAPITSSMPEAVAVNRGGIEQEVIEAIEEDRPGFAGGWVNSLALDRLLDGLRAGGKIPRSGRRDLMRSIGYDWHPALRDGRVYNPIPCPSGPGKPKLYVQAGHPAVSIQSPADVARAYLEAQSGTTPAGQAFGAGGVR